jgi:hypothetical protein
VDGLTQADRGIAGNVGCAHQLIVHCIRPRPGRFRANKE